MVRNEDEVANACDSSKNKDKKINQFLNENLLKNYGKSPVK